jgi:hypothetical protein
LNESGSDNINDKTAMCSSTEYAVEPFSLPFPTTLAAGLPSLQEEGVSRPEMGVVEWRAVLTTPSIGVNRRG